MIGGVVFVEALRSRGGSLSMMCGFGERKAYLEPGVARFGDHPHTAAVPVDHDAPGHVQSQTSAFADWFGGEEGLEDLLMHVVRNSGAGITDLDEQLLPVARRVQSKGS